MQIVLLGVLLGLGKVLDAFRPFSIPIGDKRILVGFAIWWLDQFPAYDHGGSRCRCIGVDFLFWTAIVLIERAPGVREHVLAWAFKLTPFLKGLWKHVHDFLTILCNGLFYCFRCACLNPLTNCSNIPNFFFFFFWHFNIIKIRENLVRWTNLCILTFLILLYIALDDSF